MLSSILLLLLNAQVPKATELAYLIAEVSIQENVDPILVTRMVIVESRGNPRAINWKTGDYGIAQINVKSHPHIPMTCLMNAECGLREGIKILKATKRPCQYNLGRGVLTEARMRKCVQYESKLASIN